MSYGTPAISGGSGGNTNVADNELEELEMLDDETEEDEDEYELNPPNDVLLLLSMECEFYLFSVKSPENAGGRRVPHLFK